MGGRLVGKVACISGIGRGQGRAAALRFAAEGARVVGCDLNAEEGARTAADAGGSVEFVRANAMEEADVAAWIGRNRRRCSNPDPAREVEAAASFPPAPPAGRQPAIRACPPAACVRDRAASSPSPVYGDLRGWRRQGARV
jgi:NAD(P)-dependent dehydrogenase (short-subunit alcohol dehydrogenase family)